jgi:hypothetical protein
VKPTVDFRRFFPLLVIVLLFFSGTGLVLSKAKQVTALELLSPAGCPLDGCAAGQRLNMRLSFLSNCFHQLRKCHDLRDIQRGSDNPSLYRSRIRYWLNFSPRPGKQRHLFPVENCGGNTLLMRISLSASRRCIPPALPTSLIWHCAEQTRGAKWLHSVHVLEKDSAGVWSEKSSASWRLIWFPRRY